jgi:hypothetical protein
VPVGCPLAEGNVGKDSVALLRKSGYSGPVCLHVEYLKGKVTEPGALKAAVEATRKDFATLKVVVGLTWGGAGGFRKIGWNLRSPGV